MQFDHTTCVKSTWAGRGDLQESISNGLILGCGMTEILKFLDQTSYKKYLINVLLVYFLGFKIIIKRNNFTLILL